MRVRVIEYFADVEGQEVPEMFCLATDLMDHEEYPAPELAALYKWRWDGSETALREAKAPLRGAGPGTGPMLRSGSPDLVRQELAAWAAAVEMTRGVTRDAALAAPPAGKGRRAGLTVRPRDLSLARAIRAVTAAIRSGRACYDAVTREIAGRRDHRRPRPAPRPQVQVTQSGFGACHREGHRDPHRPRHHHHGQHARLTSGNSGTRQAGRTPAGPWTRPPPARHAGLRHAYRKGTTRRSQKRELRTTGQHLKPMALPGHTSAHAILSAQTPFAGSPPALMQPSPRYSPSK